MGTIISGASGGADFKLLRNASAKNGIISFATQITKLAINGTGIIVLARLLPPADHGLIAIVLAITGFFLIFRDAGLPEATIQAHEISHGQLTNVFWINFALSCAVAVFLVLIAPLVAWFYNDPRLLLITIVLAIPFIISGAGTQHIALLKRNLRFSRIAALEVSAALCANLLGMAMALWGAGYWSLVLVPLTLSATSTALAWMLSGWRPGWPERQFAIREVLRFGAHITAFDVVNYFARNADKLLIAKVYGAAAVGVYAKAYQLFLLPLSQIKGPAAAVALPAMSRLQKEPALLRAYYIRLLEVLAFTTMPLAAFLFISAKPIVQLLLGSRWLEVTPILQILALGGLIQSVETTRGLVMLSLGQSGKYLRYGIYRSIYTAGSFIIGLRWGPVGVAAAYVIAGYLALVPSLAYCFRGTPIKVVDFFRAIAPSLCATLISIAAVSYFTRVFAMADITFIVVAALSGVLVNVAVLAVLPNGRAIIKRMYAYLKLGLTGIGSSYAQPVLSLRNAMGIAKRLRKLRAFSQRWRSTLARPAVPPAETSECIYAQSSDRELARWIIHDERWTRIVHRARHRQLVKLGQSVDVVDDAPAERPPDLQLRGEEIVVLGDAATSDEWFYMFFDSDETALKDISWRFRFCRRSSFREIQFGFRYQDFYNRYRFRIEKGFLFFDLVERGQFTNELGRVRCDLELDRWYQMRIDAIGNIFGFWLDGKQLLVSLDPRNRFPRGSVAVILWDNQGIPIQAGITKMELHTVRSRAVTARIVETAA